MSTGGRNQLEYQHRVNRVVDYIQEHRTEELSLDALAQVAAFSPFHFHRIFKAVTGENLREFIQRVRLEWAGSALLNRPDADVLTIALDCGFQSASAFARAFKERFGMTATEWRGGGAQAWSKDRLAVRKPRQAERKPGNDADDGDGHPASTEGDPSSTPMEAPVHATVRNLPSYRVAYMRHVGPYGAQGGIPALWMRLKRWAEPRDLWTASRLCLGVAYDDPRVADPAKCRYDAGIVIPPGLEPDPQVNVVDVPGGKFVVVPFTGTAADIAGCWDRVFAEWFPASGYQPDHRPCVELYHGDAFDERTGVVTCEMCTPIAPL